MFRLDSSFSKYVISHCKIASREYNFILKNLPGEPWIMRIKAVKSVGAKGYHSLCSLKVRRINEKKFNQPSMKSENPYQAISLTLSMFLKGEIVEIGENKSYK